VAALLRANGSVGDSAEQPAVTENDAGKPDMSIVPGLAGLLPPKPLQSCQYETHV
jgi:hypothetical protein